MAIVFDVRSIDMRRHFVTIIYRWHRPNTRSARRAASRKAWPDARGNYTRTPDIGRPTKAQLEKVMAGHILAQAELLGSYQKQH